MANSPSDSEKAAANASKRASAAEMEAQIEALKLEVARLSEQVSRSGERSMDHIRKAAAAGVDQIKAQGDSLRSQGEAAMETFRDVESELISTVREKPLTSLAVAAGVGYLLAVVRR